MKSDPKTSQSKRQPKPVLMAASAVYDSEESSYCISGTVTDSDVEAPSFHSPLKSSNLSPVSERAVIIQVFSGYDNYVTRRCAAASTHEL